MAASDARHQPKGGEPVSDRLGEVEIEALRDATFAVEKGELCVIVGPSGAGKTLLLSSGELGREISQPLPQAYGAQHLLRVQGMLADLWPL